MDRTSDDPVISADGHVNEVPEMWERVPARYRERARAKMEKHPDGGWTINFLESRIYIPHPGRKLSDDERAREFRRDPTGGADLERRIADQGRDGVHGEVVFPNLLLALGNGPDAEFNLAVARAYNDWVYDVFSPMPERYVAAPLIPVDDIDCAVAEAERCLAKGFRTLMIPCANAFRPYHRAEYEPIWSLVEEARVPLNFHVFTGNLFFGTDFAAVEGMSLEEFATRRVDTQLADRVERLSTTVMGMAAGMGPIVHLTGGGVLERHPELRFVVTEAECGWLAWTLQAMDAMQDRRRLGLQRLSMKASQYFLRQGAVTITNDPVALRNLEFTGTDCIMWGNDYPHDEGTFPHSEKFREQIRAQTTPEQARSIFAGNAARIYGFDLDALAAVM